MTKRKRDAKDEPYTANYPPLQEWLRDHATGCQWQIPVGPKQRPDAFLECHSVGRSSVVVLVRANGRGWDIYTPLVTNDIAATFEDALARCTPGATVAPPVPVEADGAAGPAPSADYGHHARQAQLDAGTIAHLNQEVAFIEADRSALREEVARLRAQLGAPVAAVTPMKLGASVAIAAILGTKRSEGREPAIEFALANLTGLTRAQAEALVDERATLTGFASAESGGYEYAELPTSKRAPKRTPHGVSRGSR